jgi:hypothetical protein
MLEDVTKVVKATMGNFTHTLESVDKLNVHADREDRSA